MYVALFDEVAEILADSGIGKVLPDAVYLHRSRLPTLKLNGREEEFCTAVEEIASEVGAGSEYNVIKIHRNQNSVTFLCYPEFWTDPHPALDSYIFVRVNNLRKLVRSYSNSYSKPVLHRKELFIDSNHPDYGKFSRLTRQEHDAGLLRTGKVVIGTRSMWQQRLDAMGYKIVDHELVKI